MTIFEFTGRLQTHSYRWCFRNYIVFPFCTSYAQMSFNIFSTALYPLHRNSSTCTFLLIVLACVRSIYQIRYFLEKHPLYAPSSFMNADSPRHRHPHLLAPCPLQILALDTFRQPYHKSSHFFVRLRCFIPSYSIGCFHLWILTMHAQISSYRNFRGWSWPVALHPAQ